MMPRVSGPCRSPRGGLSRIALAVGIVLLAVAQAPPAGAWIQSIVPSPSDPTSCDSVTLAVVGALSSPCFEIVGATIRGPEPIPCMRPGPCPLQFQIEITVRGPNPGTPCPTVIEPYKRLFELGKLVAGEYHVRAVERVIPYGEDSTGGAVDSSFAFAIFTSYPDTACTPGFGCYILDFVPDVPRRDTDVWPQPFCTATTAPGGTAWIDLALLNSVPVGGVQATIAVYGGRDGPSIDGFIRPLAVEPAGKGTAFQVGWTAEGARLKFVLYSPTGATIPAGRGPVLRILYAVAPETPPGAYPVVVLEAIVADTTGESIQVCPTFVPIEPGRLCVAPPGCDVNGDGSSDILDIIRVVRCALAAGHDSTACPDSVAARADCNGDGALDVRDVICCVRKILRAPCLLCDRAAPMDPAGTEIGFAGPIRWVNEAEGFATIAIRPGPDLAGIQFGLDAVGAAVRVRNMKLIEGSPGFALEWVAIESGGARAALFSMSGDARTADPLRVQVAVERTVGARSGPVVAGSGTLALSGVLGGTAAGSGAPTAVVNPSVEVLQAPIQAPALLPARPNPFRASTELGFVLPADSRVTLRIYDVAGRLVRTVVDGAMPAGVHRPTWDGTDSGGRTAGTGIYFAKWNAGSAGGTERLLLLR